MSQQTGRGWCPFAIHKPIPETYEQPAITPRIAILHSAGGAAELYGWWMNPSSKGLESHVFVDDETYVDPADGLEYARLYQYVNIFVRADANLDANDIAVSLESASTVNAREPWSVPQVRTIVRFLVWACTEAPTIKAQLCPSPRGSGIGWHVQFGAPGPWTPARGKVCPGPARIKQVPGIIAEVRQRLTNPQPEEFLDMDETTFRKILREELAEASKEGGPYETDVSKRTRSLVRHLIKGDGGKDESTVPNRILRALQLRASKG